MGGFKKIGTGNTSTPTTTEQTNTSTGGFKRIEGWTGAKPATPATPEVEETVKVETTPVAEEKRGKSFWQKLSDALSFGTNMATAADMQIYGTDALKAGGQRLQEQSEKAAGEAKNEMAYIGERAAVGAADATEGIVNALGYAGQALSRTQNLQQSQDAAMWAAVTGSDSQKDLSVRLENDALQSAKNGLQDTVEFGERYRQDVENRYADDDITAGGRIAGDISEGVGGMIPSILANLIAPGSSLYIMAAGAGGNATQEALKEGKNDIQAVSYGVAVATIEAATEKMFDGVAGIFGKGAADDVIESFAKKIAKSESAQKAILKLADGLGEGFEEFVSELGTRVANELTINTDDRTFLQTLKDGGRSFLMGAAISAIMQAGGSIANGMRVNPTLLARQVANTVKREIAEQRAQQPTAGVNLPGAGTNGAEVGVGAADGNVLPGGAETSQGGEVQNPYLLPGAIQPNQKLNIDNADSTLYNNAENGGEKNDRTAGIGNFREGVSGFQAELGTTNQGRGKTDGNPVMAGVVLLSPDAQNTLNQRGVVNVELHDSSADNAAFSVALDNARNTDVRNGWAVTPKTTYDLNAGNIRTFMSADGSTGFAVAPDGDIEGVFANKQAGAPKGTTKSTIPQAIANGGTKLDCYGKVLVDIYAQHGFVPVARTTFNPEYANPGWTPDKGSPDIYFMMHNGEDVDTVVSNYNTYHVWTQAELDALPVLEYDDAYAYRDQLLAGQNGSSTKGADTFGQNTVGAAEAQFKYQDAPSQSVADKMFTEQEMQEHDLGSTHQVITNKESNTRASQMLAHDYDGEVQRLQTDEWGPVENVEGHMILEDLVDKARKSKSDADWAEVKRWKKLYDQKGGTEAAQTLQSRAQFANSTANIVAEAVEFLDGTEARKLPRTRRAEVIDTVDRQATTYEAIEEGDVDSLIKLIEQNNEIRRTTGLFAKETAKQLDWALHEVVEKYPGTAEQFLRDVAVSQIRNISLDYKKVGATEAAKTVRIMNMLSKASTVMRNLVSNNFFDPMESLSNNVGIIADALMAKATGNRTTAREKSWIGSKAKRSGSLEAGLKSYIEVALDAPVKGASSCYEGVDGDRVFKMQGNFVERLLSTWSKYQSYALRTTDEFQKGGIAAETQRGIDKLIAEGKLGEGMLPGWAEETAKQRTFQNDSTVARAMVKGRDALNSIHVGSIGAGDILLPFARVPGNLVSQAANYSPLGLVKSFRDVVNVMYDAKTGNYDAQKQAQAARNFGRGVSGTALLGLFTTLALKGLIDVAGADDKDKEALEKAQGKTGTQWNLSATLRALGGKDTTWQDGDTLMSIGFLEPLNAVMAAGALIADDYEDDGHVNLVDVASSSLGALWQAVLDLPAMTSINDLINTYNYAEGETAGDKLANAGLEYAGSQASSFLLPNAIRGIATGLDDTVRNQYAGETIAEGVIDSFKSGIPGLRQTLPASLDPLGRERTQTGSTVLNMLNNNLLPGAITTYKETAVESTLADVYDSTGEAGIYPNKSAPSSVSVDGDPYPLTPERKDTYVRTAGQVAAEIMGGMAGSKNFVQAGNADKAAYLSLANQYARAIAANKATNGLYKLDGFAKKATEAERQGIPASDFLMFYNDAKKYDSDGNGSMKITETAAAIQNSGLTRNDQLIMWGLYYPDWTAKASEAGVDFGDLVQYKVVTNRAGATKKDQKIAALQAAGYSYEKAVDLYNKLK